MRNFLLILLTAISTQFANGQCDASFSSTVSGNTAQFTSTIQGTDIYHYWTFGDGANGYGATTTHSYSLPGTYIVTQFLTDSLGNCSDSVSSVISINFQTECSAAFSVSADSAQSGLYHFTSTSTITGGSISAYNWIINGVSNSGGPSFSTNFTTGTDTVCLSITTTAGCTSSTCQTVSVPPGGCNIQGSIMSYTIPNTPGGVQFIATPFSSGLEYNWQFGDGNSSNIYNPQHVYNQGGNYIVTLFISDSSGLCADSTSINLSITIDPLDSCNIDFTYSNNPLLPGEINFTATSNQNILWQHWTFQSLGNSYFDSTSVMNPTQVFQDSGIYTVCVYIITNTGCQAEICKNITVSTAPPSGRYANTIPVYPNPINTNEMKLKLNLQQAERITFTIFNTSGIPIQQSVQAGITGNNIITIPVGNLKTGQYFMDIRYGSERKRSIFQKI